MNDKDLERFQDNYAADAEALPLVAELHATYGESFLCECLRGDDILHTLSIMCEVKQEMRDKFLLSVCSTNHINEHELGLDGLFPNLIHLMSYEKMLEHLEEKGWISIFTILRPFRLEERYRYVDKTIYAKGYNWEKCPKSIQEHFIKIKKEKSTISRNLKPPQGEKMQAETQIKNVNDYLPIKEFCNRYSSIISLGGLRWILFNSKFNGARSKSVV